MISYRYADIIVHRLLAVCIGADATYPELLDKKKNHLLCQNLNYRNRMAQYAGRASVALHTHVSVQFIMKILIIFLCMCDMEYWL